MEERDDILVYTSEPLGRPSEVSGPVELTVYVSSDAKDTDVTVKLIDVGPDGKALQPGRDHPAARYREGYDKPPVWMEKDKVYKVTLAADGDEQSLRGGPPDPDRGLEQQLPALRPQHEHRRATTTTRRQGKVAHNSVHHSKQYPSSLTLTVVKRIQP